MTTRARLFGLMALMACGAAPTGTGGGLPLGGGSHGVGGGSSGAGGGTATCSAAGATCRTQSDCCSNSSGGRCVRDVEATPVCTDSCQTNSDCNSGCCTALQDGARVCLPAKYCGSSKAGIGDRCSSASQCASGVCGQLGLCTAQCASSIPDCNGRYTDGMNVRSQYNFCVPSSAGTKWCFSGCSTNADCAPFGAQCITVKTTSGATRNVCSL